MKAAILAIGTEVTTGQITNKNAAWISRKLSEFGIQVTTHLAVPDERELILQSLGHIQKNDFIFLTGGLGPTSDDFTRDVVRDFAKLEMFFDPESWDMLSERLTSRGYSVKDIQRQQCYFPVGSSILRNSQGTANGFWFTHAQSDFFILPGPPKEVEACWFAGVHDRLKSRTQSLDPLTTYYWDTMGLGESDLAMLVAPLTDQLQKHKGLEIGFRVHLPYVEFKITLRKSQAQLFTKEFSQIDATLKPFLVSTGGEDLADTFSQKLKKYSSVSFNDNVSQGFLLQRLSPSFKEIKNFKSWSYSNSHAPISDSELEFGLFFCGENSAEISMRKKRQLLKVEVSTPYQKPLMSERRKQYFAELAIIQWNKWLQN